MKVRTSVKKMCEHCKVIRRKKRDPALKAELESYMNNGKLVPIETVVKVFKTNFEDLASEHPTARGFILDGFPRNKDQANALNQLCSEWQAELAKVIYLHVSMDVVKQRATGRRFCSKNARHVYNVNDSQLAPKDKKIEQNREIWLCDIDGAELIVRPDDEPETVEKRLQEYKKETDPLIEYFKGTKQLVEINGEQDPSLVTQAIEAEIQPLLGLSPTS